LEKQELVFGHRSQHPVDENTNEVVRVVDVVDASLEISDTKDEDQDDTECSWCSDSPCVWPFNRDAMAPWDKNENGHLAGNTLPISQQHSKMQVSIPPNGTYHIRRATLQR
jgi:hypothetical protein